jgi:hypothetical protein
MLVSGTIASFDLLKVVMWFLSGWRTGGIAPNTLGQKGTLD